MLTSFGNCRASRCPAGSRLYAADTSHLIRAGLSSGKTVLDTVHTRPRVFVTLPAILRPRPQPRHHSRRRHPALPLPQSPRTHGPTDALIGTPLNPGTYDDEDAVLVSAHASALWARFTTYLRREIAAELGMTQRGPRGPAGVLREGRRVRVRVTVESDAAGDRELGWGGQFDVREIASSDMRSLQELRSAVIVQPLILLIPGAASAIGQGLCMS
ncbi:replication initiator [Streptomyces microflavus]|uniref:replication initiator n=1 Tax=Streptomyces microflavus TaxID=1919 RepID=UPI0034123F88